MVDYAPPATAARQAATELSMKARPADPARSRIPAPHDPQGVGLDLQTLLDASPDAVLIVDGTGTIVALNRRAEALFATPAGRLQGQPVETLLPVRTRQAHTAARGGYHAAPTARAMSARSGLMGLRADGTEFPVEVSLTPIAGSTAGLVMAVVHDVASRAFIEAAAAGARRALEALDAIEDAVLTIDADGHVDFLNRSAEALTGWARDSACGRPVREVLPLVDSSGEPWPASPTSASSCEAILPATAAHQSRVLDVSTTPILDAAQALTGAALVARDVTHARLIAQRLAHQATHDALTGLVNRAEFERRLVHALASAAAERVQHVVCFLDMDGFKRVNDVCGHLAGDEFLRQLSDLMRERVRSRDTLARLGGDEFGILLEHCRLPRAERVAEEIRKGIAAHRFTVGAETHAVAVSIGIVPIRRGIRRADDVIRAADAACYAAKRSGGNRIQVSLPPWGVTGAPSEDEWSRRLVSAVEQNRFRLHAQPLQPLDGGGPTSPRFELLLRLDDGTGKPLPPQAFLPAARRHGLMPLVDRWVLREAILRLSAWQRVHPDGDPLTLAVNLDDETVAGGAFGAVVQLELSSTDVTPEALCFEISESVVAAHPGVSARLVHELRAVGCQTTLEHAGSGMAAFTMLRRLRPDYLKIAGHIIRGLARDPVHRALATALNETGHALGLKTIGVQVEGPGVLAWLRRIGVDYAQGFGIGRPEPLEQAMAQLG